MYLELYHFLNKKYLLFFLYHKYHIILLWNPLLLEDNLTSNRNKIQSKIKISEYYFLDKNGFHIDKEEDKEDYTINDIIEKNQIKLISETSPGKDINAYDELIIRYDIATQNESALFGKQFVENNKFKCKVIIEGIEHELDYGYTMYNSKLNRYIHEIKIKGIKNITDFSYMFSGINNLVSILNNPYIIIKPTKIDYMFSFGYYKLMPDFSNWDFTDTTSMKGLFFNVNLYQR